MQFYLNGVRQNVVGFDPNLTLLRYLRTETKLKGTKEGCASGDCGACTVLTEDGNGSLMSVNSCIALLGSFAGKNVYTVEGIVPAKSSDEQTSRLHPVQQAMVECHGSQCGFCTPGFVMSLAGLYQQCVQGGHSKPRPDQIYDAISGNLCRCTGYKPILNAASKMFDYERIDFYDAGKHQEQVTHSYSANSAKYSAQYSAQYSAKKSESTSEGQIEENDTEGYHLPASETELQQLLLNYPDARIVSGGTDMVLEITQNYLKHELIIDLSHLPELNKIYLDDDYLNIGGAASYKTLETYIASLSEQFLSLLHRLGSRQIRNRGSLGGNIANSSPIADTPPALMVWEAELEIVDSQNNRRWVSINDFYLSYKRNLLQKAEYISAIRIPRKEIDKPHRFYKVSKRFEDDISAVMGAFVIELDESSGSRQRKISTLRIAYGGVAATPVRANKTETFLSEKVLDKTLLDEALLDEACQILAREFTPMTDVRATKEYRNEMVVNLFRKAMEEIIYGETSSLLTESAANEFSVTPGEQGHA